MLSVDKAVEDVARQAESIKNDEEQRITNVELGDDVRQGDIYLTRLESVPTGAKPIKFRKQLAPGNTQGSRHTIRSSRGVKMYEVGNASPLDGPIIESKGNLAIDHPEHGNLILPPGIYATTYQRAFAAELRRVAD